MLREKSALTVKVLRLEITLYAQTATKRGKVKQVLLRVKLCTTVEKKVVKRKRLLRMGTVKTVTRITEKLQIST